MKKIIYIFFALIVTILFIPSAMAEEDNLVNIYLFHQESCPHCQKEIKLLDKLDEEYSNIKIYKYEIGSEENKKLFDDVANLLQIKVSGVPFTIIGEKTFVGFSDENSKKSFTAAIEYYSKYGYEDKVGTFIGNIPLPTLPKNENDIKFEEYMEDYGNYSFDLPLVGKVETKNLTLPLIAILIGLIDGFNPCAMWILLFLISMLIGMHDKKKMMILGFAFLFASAFAYFLLMLAWLNVSKILTSVVFVRCIIGIIAIILGLFNLINSFRKKDDGCTVTDDKKRNKIFERIKKFTKEKNIWIALGGVIALAIGVNIIELACSAGLPLMFTEILSMNNLSKFSEIAYILLYILFFMIDDIIVFLISLFTLKITGLSTKYGKISKVVGGLILVILGFLLIFFPNIVMLNF